MARDHFAFESFDSASMPADLPDTISDLYLRTFYHEPFGQYLLDTETGRALSAEQVFGFNSKHSGMLPLETLTQLDLKKIHRDGTTPYEFWLHPERTRQLFRKKFRNDAFATLMRSEETGELTGVTFGFERKLQDHFQLEEWQDPFLYSEYKDPSKFRELPRLLTGFNRQTQESGQWLTPSSNLFAISGTLILPSARHPYHFFEMMRQFLGALPEQTRQRGLISEVIGGEMTHLCMRGQGGVDAVNFLGEQHHLTLATVQSCIDWFFRANSEIMGALKTTRRALAETLGVASAA